MSPYQYVVMRCVPRIDREEFVNVGVVLYCQAADYLDARWHVDAARIHALDDAADIDAVCDRLHFIDGVCRGEVGLGEVANGDLGTRFGFIKSRIEASTMMLLDRAFPSSESRDAIAFKAFCRARFR